MATFERIGAPAKARRERDRRTGRPPLTMMLLGFLFVAFLTVPLAALLWRALQRAHAWNYFNDDIVVEALKLSLLTSTLTLIAAFVFGTPVAFMLGRYRFPGRRVVETMLDLPLVLPPVVAGIALLMAFGRRGVLGSELKFLGLELPFTTTAVVIAQFFVSAPFFVRSAKAGFAAVDPDVEAAAQLDGASIWRVLVGISVPAAFPAMAAGAVLCWARALSEFGATQLFAGNFEGSTQTMPLAIMTAYESDLNAALAISVVLLAIAFLILMLSRALTRGDSYT
ncbi:ABC transporter permease [soil metagenome]